MAAGETSLTPIRRTRPLTEGRRTGLAEALIKLDAEDDAASRPMGGRDSGP